MQWANQKIARIYSEAFGNAAGAGADTRQVAHQKQVSRCNTVTLEQEQTKSRFVVYQLDLRCRQHFSSVDIVARLHKLNLL